LGEAGAIWNDVRFDDAVGRGERPCFVHAIDRYLMSKLTKIAGAIAIVVVSFFATLIALDYAGFPNPTEDQVRARNAKQVMAALEKYRAVKGTYPVLPVTDSVTSELRTPLVEGHFIAAIPVDPPDAAPTRYVSVDGKAFGLLVFQNKKNCLIEVRTTKSQWWGQPPPCQF
jgi:type II secretory pathway pseudopilin PulG